jgi:subtilisin family serine protease
MPAKRNSKTRRRPQSEATKPRTDQPTFGGSGRERLDVLPGQYFVRVHPGAIRPHVPARARAAFGPARMAFGAATANAVPEAVVEPLQYLRDNTGMKNVRPLFEDAGRTRVSRVRGAAVDRARLALAASVVTQEDDDIAGLAIAEFDPKADARAIAHAASANAIDYIEPVPARWLMATDGPAAVDPMQNLQWGLRAVRWFDGPLPDASSVTVGILDTGIDAGHPDLAAVRVTYDHTGTRAEDIVGHGTHVAGIVAAEANNAIGITGVARCAMHVWKIFGDEPFEGEYYVDPDLFADALRAASMSGLSGINLSIGGTASSNTEQRLIRRLVDRGVVVVAAMGNEFHDGNPTEYPAAYDDVLAVGAIAENRERSDFSNTGRHIGICAPGSNILSTLPRRRSSYRSERMYASWSGTSMATPHVTAAVALLAAEDPSLSASDIDRRLRATAATLSAMNGKARTNEYGAGLLDLARALT